VCTDDALSAVLPITSGVVRGSVLGHMLFSMFNAPSLCWRRPNLHQLWATSHRKLYTQHEYGPRPNSSMVYWELFGHKAGKIPSITAVWLTMVNPFILPSLIVSPLLLGSNHIAFVDKVKNLGIIFIKELTLKIIYRWISVKSTILYIDLSQTINPLNKRFWLLIWPFYIVNFTVSLLILRFRCWFCHFIIEINNIKW
jgi:hypothetical protein